MRLGQSFWGSSPARLARAGIDGVAPVCADNALGQCRAALANGRGETRTGHEALRGLGLPSPIQGFQHLGVELWRELFSIFGDVLGQVLDELVGAAQRIVHGSDVDDRVLASVGWAAGLTESLAPECFQQALVEVGREEPTMQVRVAEVVVTAEGPLDDAKPLDAANDALSEVVVEPFEKAAPGGEQALDATADGIAGQVGHGEGEELFAVGAAPSSGIEQAEHPGLGDDIAPRSEEAPALFCSDGTSTRHAEQPRPAPLNDLVRRPAILTDDLKRIAAAVEDASDAPELSLLSRAVPASGIVHEGFGGALKAKPSTDAEGCLAMGRCALLPITARGLFQRLHPGPGGAPVPRRASYGIGIKGRVGVRWVASGMARRSARCWTNPSGVAWEARGPCRGCRATKPEKRAPGLGQRSRFAILS